MIYFTPKLLLSAKNLISIYYPCQNISESVSLEISGKCLYNVLFCGREHAPKHFCFSVWLALYSTQEQTIPGNLRQKTLSELSNICLATIKKKFTTSTYKDMNTTLRQTARLTAFAARYLVPRTILNASVTNVYFQTVF